jgi:hypothetical protein
MFERVREGLKEIVELASECPEQYQVKCFEVLLQKLVQSEEVAVSEASAKLGETPQAPAARHRFFEEYGISDEEWVKIFDLDGNSYSVIARDLKEKASARKQMKLALLLGVKNLLETGDPVIRRQELVPLCQEHAAYDGPNFAGTMKRYSNLWTQKPKAKGEWRLTHPGREEAARVIRELAS